MREQNETTARHIYTAGECGGWWAWGAERAEWEMFNDQSESKNRFLLHQSETATLCSFALPLFSQSNGKALRRVWLHTVFYLGECEDNQLNPAFKHQRPYHTSKTGNAFKQEQNLRWEKRTSQWTGRGENYMWIKILIRSMKDIESTKLYQIMCHLKLIIITGQFLNAQSGRSILCLPHSNTHIRWWK